MIEGDYLANAGAELKKLGYCSIVIASGSYAYKHNSLSHLKELRDIDILIILNHPGSLYELIKNHQSDLDLIFSITTETEKKYTTNDLEAIKENIAQAIRYSGVNKYGQKTSLKIIEKDFLDKTFDCESPIKINVLSQKDKRFYTKRNFLGQTAYLGIINQKLPNGQVLLGDPDFIEINNHFSLGVICDELLSGKIIFEDCPDSGLETKKKLLKKVFLLASNQGCPLDSKNWLRILYRNDFFCAEYIRQLQEFAQKTIFNLDQFDNNNLELKSQNADYDTNIVTPITYKPSPQLTLLKKTNGKPSEVRYLNNSGPFSSNSKYGVAIFEDDKKLFFKETKDSYRFRGEIYGLITCSPYYSHLQEPEYTDPEKKLIAYKWFPGDILAKKRLTPLSEESIKFIMETELRKSEDLLNGYIYSTNDIKNGIIDKDDLYISRIHDLFYGRLTNSRFKDFYQTVVIPAENESINFPDLTKMPITINGKDYPPLEKLIENAKNMLNPETLRHKLLICGLGDLHSGNVMVTENIDNYLFIDYEFAGFHSPYLDIAKAIYNDCSYNIFYEDHLPKQKYDIRAYSNNGKFIIEHNYKLDNLSKYLLKTKINGIIKPYHQYINSKSILQDPDWNEILGSALLCCGLLTRNISLLHYDGFLLNLANAIETTDFKSYYELNS